MPDQLTNKEDSIYELITDNDLDVLALTETWCTDNYNVSLGLVTPPGYTIVQTHRSSLLENNWLIAISMWTISLTVEQINSRPYSTSIIYHSM